MLFSKIYHSGLPVVEGLLTRVFRERQQSCCFKRASEGEYVVVFWLVPNG